MPLHVEVVAPSEGLFSGDADFVRLMTVEGDIGILPGHIPLLAQIAPCEIKVRTPQGDRLFPVAGGFITVKEDKVIILTEEVSAQS